jgi:hypothetical protein
MEHGDAQAILQGLFDIRTDVRRIVSILQDDEQEGNEEADS